MVNDWLVDNGIIVVFMTVAAINVAVYLTTIIFYIKGKSFRIWTSEKNFLSRAGLD